MLGLKPGKGFIFAMFLLSTIVSPTQACEVSFILAVIKPTSPACNSSTSSGFGLKTPTLSI